jgi:transmembrane sensor
MAKLQAPIRQLIDDRLPEARVHRMWRELQQARARSRRRAWLLPLVAAAAACLLGLSGWFALRVAPTPGALALSGSDTLGPSRVLGADGPTAWPLSDGSRIQLDGASRLRVLENTDRAFAARLESGHGSFEVQPGGPRRWRIDCGGLRVEVVGTGFSVDRDAHGVGVEVRHGVVRVRSPRLVGGAQRLAAGERLYLPDAPAVGAVQAAKPVAGRAPTTSAAVVQPPPMAASPSAPRSVHEPGELLRRADQARRAGQRARAEELLERVRAQAPGTPHAALAGLTLARMRIASEPALAADDLSAALAADLPAGLREDTLARLVEAHARAGALARARAAAERYRRAYPHGHRSAEVERWAQLP